MDLTSPGMYLYQKKCECLQSVNINNNRDYWLEKMKIHFECIRILIKCTDVKCGLIISKLT